LKPQINKSNILMKSMQGTVKMLNKEHMTKKDKVLLRGLNKDY